MDQNAADHREARKGSTMGKVNLTAKAIRDALPTEREYTLTDLVVRNLALRILPSGQKIYTLLYMDQAGRRKRLTLGNADVLSVAQARILARQRQADIAKGIDPSEEKKKAKRNLTLRQFMDEHYTPWLLSNLRSGKEVDKSLRRAFKSLMNMKLSAISAFHVEKVRAELTKAGKRVASNRYSALFKALVARAHKWEFLETNIIAGKVSRHKEDRGRVRYLDAAEEARLLEALDRRQDKQREERARMIAWAQKRHLPTLPDLNGLTYTDYLKPLILAVLYSGMRRGEAFSLLWSDINWEQNTITIRAESAKSEKMRHIPMCAALRQVLEQWQAQGMGQGLVFPSPKTGGRLDNIQTSWERLIKDAKIEGFRFHDLRHSFASRLAMAGVDLNTIRELLGHSDLKMTLRYAHLSPARTQAAVNVLDRIDNVLKFERKGEGGNV